MLCRRDCGRKINIWVLFLLFFTVALCYSSSYATQKFFYTKTGIDASQGLPATAYIYMGITSDDESSVCGPGTYNSSSVNLYNDNNKNAKQTQAAAAEKIKEALVDYTTGRRSMDFFIKKIRNQWADPWFSSMIIVINYYDIDRPLKESFRSFLSGPLIGKLQTYGRIVIWTSFIPKERLWENHLGKFTDVYFFCRRIRFLYCLGSEGEILFALFCPFTSDCCS
mgnify:CR=1 FL=1